ncbi:DNA topoisomerase 6 subunit A [Trifolium repens]|nr:DNA topoisomerase 6 subunit A [Trifolium repens]
MSAKDIRDGNVISCRAKFIMLVEKYVVLSRLAEDEFYKKYECIIITGRGQPDENIEWVEALNMMVQRGEKFEIEALSTKKIDYLTHDYLPFKLKKLLARLEDDDKKRVDEPKEDAAAQRVDE